jgi:hypothetical protein
MNYRAIYSVGENEIKFHFQVQWRSRRSFDQLRVVQQIY